MIRADQARWNARKGGWDLTHRGFLLEIGPVHDLDGRILIEAWVGHSNDGSIRPVEFLDPIDGRLPAW